jgi:hypothetical protein
MVSCVIGDVQQNGLTAHRPGAASDERKSHDFIVLRFWECVGVANGPGVDVLLDDAQLIKRRALSCVVFVHPTSEDASCDGM